MRGGQLNPQSGGPLGLAAERHLDAVEMEVRLLQRAPDGEGGTDGRFERLGRRRSGASPPLPSDHYRLNRSCKDGQGLPVQVVKLR